ncbi:hypothetical protein IHQ68_06410 [Chelatococcus sambhunathii]|uniref:SGNH hydrolase-type esterase domain-containing protein n=1 Tax=Chelatococcus sambhunathii TaxID=363953 RepID=A0ABU1DDP7_9HYPH|nr:hypothetical protein [Chelatococcus sambhunathii]MDR4306248.1 hypothetical protein [Chelatococcus sambhunathii]
MTKPSFERHNKSSGSRIVVIGDSHSRFWLGHDSVRNDVGCFAGVDVWHLGALTAYNSSKILDIDDVRSLQDMQNPYSAIILSFGEIDCRAHALKQAHLQCRSIDVIAKDIADRLFETAIHLYDLARTPIVLWAPPPTAPKTTRVVNPRFPSIGSMYERNYATSVFIDRIKELSVGKSWISVCSIFDDLILPDGGTKPGILYDGFHLSSVFFPLARDALVESCRNLGLADPSPCFRRNWGIDARAQYREVSIGLVATVSSVPAGVRTIRIGDKRFGGVAIESAPSDDSWCEVDLQGEFQIKYIQIILNNEHFKAEDVRCEISVDRNHRMVMQGGEVEGSFFVGGSTLLYARYIRISRITFGAVSIRNIRVCALTYDTRYPSIDEDESAAGPSERFGTVFGDA